MGRVGDAWRAASRRQKVTIAVAVVVALGGLASLTTPSGSLAPGQPSTALGRPTSGTSLEAKSIAAETPTEPLVAAPASNNPTVEATPATTVTAPIPTATLKPSPSPVALSVRITSVTSPAYRSSFATLTVRTHAGARCSIEVDYASGPSSAAGLIAKTATSSGTVTWTWKIGGRTTKGTWPIYVTCSWKSQSADASTSFVVA